MDPNKDEDVDMHSNSSSTVDPTMVSAYTHLNDSRENVAPQPPRSPVDMTDEPVIDQSAATAPNMGGLAESTVQGTTNDTDQATSMPTLDLLPRITGLYRLLDLINEQGSGGIVDKVIISQESVGDFINQIHPGSYKSEIQIDFRALDGHVIKPLGVYGSIPAIVDFLDRLGCISQETKRLLLTQQDGNTTATQPSLRPGLYALTPTSLSVSYIVFWPEVATWQDGLVSSIARNRVTFMRYMTKLCDQVICLISEEHSAKLVSKDQPTNSIEDEEEEDETYDVNDRVFKFSVEQTKEEEETANPKQGFSINHRLIEAVARLPHGSPKELSLDILQPRLVVGDSSQAILQVEFIPDEVETTLFNESWKIITFNGNMGRDNSPTLILGDQLSPESMPILFQNGLQERCGNVYTEWRRTVDEADKQRIEDEKLERSNRLLNLQKEMAIIHQMMPFYLVRKAITLFPILSEYEDTLVAFILDSKADHATHVDTSEAFAKVAAWFKKRTSEKDKAHSTIKQQLSILETNHRAAYNTLKRNTRYVEVLRATRNDLSSTDIQRLIDHIKEKESVRGEALKILEDKGKEVKWDIKRIYNTIDVKRIYNTVTGSGAKSSQIDLPLLDEQDDVEFAKNLQRMASGHPEYSEAIDRIKKAMVEILKKRLKKLHKTSHEIEKVQSEQISAEIERDFEAKKSSEMQLALQDLKHRTNNTLLSDRRRTGAVLKIEYVKEETTWNQSQRSFRVCGFRSFPKKSGFSYTLHPLDIKSDDMHKISSDPHHICSPVIRHYPPPSITVPLDETMRYIRLVGRDKCLVVLSNEEWLNIYFDSVNTIASAIDTQRHVKRLNFRKLGQNCHFAIDETKRLFAVLSIQDTSVLIYTFVYDVDARTFTARGGAVNITRWYHQKPEFDQFVFLAGTEELLLVEKRGTARLFSLVSENMRPSTLELKENITAAFSSPDGACLFTITQNSASARIRCFHWASFGANGGVEIPWPEDTSKDSRVVVSSVGNRASTHIIFLDTKRRSCSSVYIQITRKSSEFTFRSNSVADANKANTTSVNNSLIDCHAEVWTRFPVHAAIRRETNDSAIHRPRTITFVSSASEFQFPQYFASMIREFEITSRKPTKGILKRIKVAALPELDVHSEPQGISELQAGDWLVGLFCLIPIHLAVTGSNRFIPLKDGVISPKFEQSLLGANVAQISEALSFGWYESIFSSYLARKPVKVVTSMGEQSVGKSFSLNHFVDTSFAGSAMRCTEGVWLSLTPTRDYLAVALDFEGVHSIERTAQEDTLLVLLNAAISNFVLFRNNFAMSRDIAGLFTSFQSCSTVLDPASNPSLFNSTLGIVIKDVIDSDTREIVNEFQQKFQRIVQTERGDNFISKLHKGKLDIIPWPVIGSSRFYDLFNALRARLDTQPLTHKHAGAFLTVLKMLMAKLKANDWGALDQNLAVQRAEYLTTVLDVALAFGTIDPINGDPLTNLDTDEVIPNNDNGAALYLEAAEKRTPQALSVDSCLRKLCEEFDKGHNRFEAKGSDYLRALTKHLHQTAEARIAHVRQWLKANTVRFGDKAEVSALFREFDSKIKEIRSSVALCGSKCSSCDLLCLEHKEHNGNHDCHTNHKCPNLCGFPDQHIDEPIPMCDIPAGHAGRHVCIGIPHLCGLQCQLHGKDGCLKSCSKPMSHEDEEHLCSARVHACGEPCGLVGLLKSDGTPICTRRCVVDCNQEHVRHTCDRALSCPVKCQLCNSFCAAGDHFHALEEDAVHLCGQTHACSSKCEMPGVCEIATTPQSVESTFRGRHTTFQYTKYTQEARRLHCIVPIEANKTDHEGPHVHSQDPNVFHHCEERCRHCGYYCTLPLNHNQNEHDTSHGSMSHSEWVVEGDDDAVFELEGRKYATGDNGAPMLCSMLCKSLGRHVHIDNCRTEDGEECGGEGYEHINRPNANTKQDWITHRLYWAKSGFKDPCTNTEQEEFDLCDHRCPGEEHDANINQNAVPSLCTLSLFHPPADPDNPPPLGHISRDGHSYNCKSPALNQRSFHIFFALDRSGSMTCTDNKPLAGTPATQRIAQVANNRFGAVISSLYGFWTAREAAIRSGSAAGVRRDAYTIITFDHDTTVTLTNDTTSDSDQLLDHVLGAANDWGLTDFTKAIETIQEQMEATWATDRSPVVIFLSDGECDIEDTTMYDLCRAALRLGKPLSFHSVSFGVDRYSQYLRRMATIASEVYEAAPRDPLTPPVQDPCLYHNALDTVQLASTFLGIAESLKNTRAALSRI